MAKIFITGGAGFIANRIINDCIDDNEIVVYDNFERDTLATSSLMDHPNLTVIKGDIRDFDPLYEAMAGASIVIHCAAICGIYTVLRDAIKTMHVNMCGTANVLEAATCHKIKDRFVDFSTSEIFGSSAFRANENFNAVTGAIGESRWTYAVSKLASEHLAHAYFKQHKLPVVTIRPFNVYGPGQTGEGAIQIFIQKALQDKDIYINGDGTQIRDWCYIDDFSDAVVNSIYNPKAIGESFNIGNPKTAITILHLAETICRVLNSKSKIIFRKKLSADVALRLSDITKAKRLLDFNPKVGLEEGILKTAKWIGRFNEHIDLHETSIDMQILRLRTKTFQR